MVIMAVRVCVMCVLLQGAVGASEFRIDAVNAGQEDRASNTFRSTSVKTVTVEAEKGSGQGWNMFRTAGIIGSRSLTTGKHRIQISISGGDSYGIEIDCTRLKMI